jgi:hypothetical protein
MVMGTEETMMARSRGWPRSLRIPSAMDLRIGSRASERSGGGSGRRIDRSRAAEIRKETASARTATGADSSWTSAPARPGPAAAAAE